MPVVIKRDDLRIKKRLLERHWTVAELARRIERPRPTVSAAVHNAERFPRVRRQILEVLFP